MNTVTLKSDQFTVHFLDQMLKRHVTVAQVEECLGSAPVPVSNGRIKYCADGYVVVASPEGVLITCFRDRPMRKRRGKRKGVRMAQIPGRAKRHQERKRSAMQSAEKFESGEEE